MYQTGAITHCGIVLLAAGASRRMGRPKQLLLYKGKPLLQRALDTIHLLQMPSVLVLGANAAVIKSAIITSGVYVVENKNWQQGIASSIVSGLQALQHEYANLDGVIFMVCDQPFVTYESLTALITKQVETHRAIIASGYAETVGIPALFHKACFKDLLSLSGDLGAKKIMELHRDSLVTVDFSKGTIDVDTEQDYQLLKND
jgi:molybdenum cofactor cytidylyltransferase